MIDWIGMAAAVLLPFWNIPLILTIERRKSSKDISLLWAFGVFACLLLMLPAGLKSQDPTFKAFSIMNVALFSGVLVEILRFRR